MGSLLKSEIKIVLYGNTGTKLDHHDPLDMIYWALLE